jgi:Hypothetical protein (DUF2513).
MKRNMDLVIAILKKVEEGKDVTESSEYLDLKATDAEILYHLEIMSEAGLIKTRSFSTFEGVVYDVERLTWDGHEFLEAARNETVVNQAKEFAKSKGLQLFDLPFDVMKDILVNSINSIITG